MINALWKARGKLNRKMKRFHVLPMAKWRAHWYAEAKEAAQAVFEAEHALLAAEGISQDAKERALGRELKKAPVKILEPVL